MCKWRRGKKWWDRSDIGRDNSWDFSKTDKEKKNHRLKKCSKPQGE